MLLPDTQSSYCSLATRWRQIPGDLVLAVGLVLYEARLADVAVVFSLLSAVCAVVQGTVLYETTMFTIAANFFCGTSTPALAFAILVRIFRRRALRDAMTYIEPDEERCLYIYARPDLYCYELSRFVLAFKKCIVQETRSWIDLGFDFLRNVFCIV